MWKSLRRLVDQHVAEMQAAEEGERVEAEKFFHWAESYISILHQLVDHYVSDPIPAELEYIKGRYNYLNGVLANRGVVPLVTPFEM